MTDTSVVVQDFEFSQSEVETIKENVAKGATDNELKMFLHQCSRTGLDPLSKQIHFIKRGGRATIQAGIDGLRAIAERTGKYAGNDDYVYNDTKTMYEMSSNGESPTTATSTVYKIVDGVRVGFSATALWDAYCPQGKESFMWNKMPYLMLGKCAEALALRKAFPNDLSGIYSTDEMQQADNQPSSDPGVEKLDKQLKSKAEEKAKALTEKVKKAKEDSYTVSKSKLNESNGMMTDDQRKEITELAEHAACKGVKDKVFEWLDKSVENHTSDVANETINKLKARIQE
tara:strand:- start:113 stop:973 length:861 start_codon:yes stop_codon:yes gene_type:complete